MGVEIISVELDHKEVMVKYSDSKSFRKYLSEGYYVFAREDGFSKLKRNAILATIRNNGKIQSINLKSALIEYYGRARDYELIEKITQDLDKDCVVLKRDSEGCWKLFKK